MLLSNYLIPSWPELLREALMDGWSVLVPASHEKQLYPTGRRVNIQSQSAIHKNSLFIRPILFNNQHWILVESFRSKSELYWVCKAKTQNILSPVQIHVWVTETVLLTTVTPSIHWALMKKLKHHGLAPPEHMIETKFWHRGS